MNPGIDKSPSLALPQPSPEQGGGSASGYIVTPHEAVPASQEQHIGPSQAQPTLTTPNPIPVAPPAVMPPVQPGDPQAAATSAAAADDTDTDELDREWINKAKAIVERTKADPYTESKELGRVKSDYMKIRYNKDIKVAEDALK